MATKDYDQLAKKIVDLVGGNKNISSLTHCVTRLRFTVKDKSVVNTAELTSLDGVLGQQWSGEQCQIIIGQDVEKLYKITCDQLGMVAEKGIEENLDQGLNGRKISLKKIGNNVLGYLSPIMFGMMPALIGASMCQVIAVILGPSVLKIITEDSGVYVLLHMMYNAFFYFLPVYTGYLASKNLKTDVILGIFTGCMIIVPTFTAMASAGTSLSVFGLSVPVADYGQTFLPVIIGVWIMSYINRFLKEHIPDIISTIAVPTLTILIMIPIMFFVCAPIGTYLGNVIGNFFIWLVNGNSVMSLIAYILMGFIFPYMILCGMHMVLINFAFTAYLANGFETYVFVIGGACSFAMYGVATGVFLKLKDKHEKSLAGTGVATGILAGVSEPILYGIILRYKNAMKALLICCGIMGVYCWALRPSVYVISLFNIFSVIAEYMGGTTGNFIAGIGSIVLGYALGCISGYFMVDPSKKVSQSGK